MSYFCCVCREVIADQLVLQCDQRHFHKQCLKCQMCCASIHSSQEKLYSINGLLVCREDYKHLRSVCHVCRQRIEANDYRFQTQNRLSIHMKCMSCCGCHALLNRGDKYVITADQRIVCQQCFSPQTTPPPAQPAPTTSRRGRKRANQRTE